MKTIETFRKRQAEQEQEQSKRTAALEQLRQQRTELEERINAAIDADKLSEVDSLTAKETELDNRIRTAEKILERKKETAIDPDEIAEANNAEMMKYQGEIDSKMKEAEKCRRQYYENLIRAAEIALKARELRGEYLQLVNAYHDDKRFDMVHGGLTRFAFSQQEIDLMNSIKPGAVNLVNSNLRG